MTTRPVSRFREELAEQHRRDLSAYGFEQVGGYLDLLDRLAEGGIVYLKQWARWHNPVDDIELSFGDYPIPSRWRLLLREPAPVQTGFTHAAWRVH